MNKGRFGEFICIVNPEAGKLPLKKKIKLIKSTIQDENLRIVVTKSPKDSSKISYNAMKNKNLVIACGGDGLQNLVAEQAVKTGGSMIPFPMGRGNDFASSLGIHNHKDVKIALTSGEFYKTRYIIAEFDQHKKVCLTCAGVGLLSEAAFRASKIPILKGSFLYAVATLLSFFKLQNHGYKILNNENKVEGSFLIIAGAASPYTGGGMFIAPDAFKESNLVNLLSAKKVSRIQAVKLLIQVFSGKHINNVNVSNTHTDRFKIDSHSSHPWAKLVYGDGEYLGNLPVEISMGQEPLNVLVPNI